MGRNPKATGPRAKDPVAFKSVLVRINAEGWNDPLKKYGPSIENPLLD